MPARMKANGNFCDVGLERLHSVIQYNCGLPISLGCNALYDSFLFSLQMEENIRLGIKNNHLQLEILRKSENFVNSHLACLQCLFTIFPCALHLLHFYTVYFLWQWFSTLLLQH